MKKKYLIILGVILGLLCVFAGLLMSGVLDSITKPQEETTQPDSSANVDGSKIYDLSAFKKDENIKLPLLPTDIEGIYYTMSAAGDVHFYRFDGIDFSSVPETGVYNVEVVCSSITIPAEVHYIDLDGTKFGCGLYTSSITPGVNLYAYAFFKLTELPKAFKSKNEYWLLLDVDSTRFYSADKVYGEAFVYDISDGSSEHFLSETQRTIAMNGIYRTDYKVFTDEIIGQSQSNVLFFSGRFYNEELNKYDIFSSGGYDLNKDNLRQVRDVLDMALFRAEDRYYYLKQDTATDGFFLCSFDGETEKNERLYAFSFEKNCIRSGAYIYEKTSRDIYNLLGGETVRPVLDGIGNDFTANMFEISDNGKYAFLRGEDSAGNIWIAASSLESGKTDVFCNEEFAKIAACAITDSGTLLLTVADSLTATVGTNYHQLILSLNAANSVQPENTSLDTPTEEAM